MKTLKRLFALVMCLLFLLTPLAATAEEPLLLGDVDDDGIITTTDARLLLSHVLCKCVIFPTEDGEFPPRQEYPIRVFAASDVDGDGELTTTDARLILQYVVEKIDAFPAEAE